MSLEGQQLGEFEILEEIGKGGMGAVYKARQTSLKRIVALKTLQASLAEEAGFIARFQQEAVAAAGLNHPNLVQVYSAGENEGLRWFAMEYVEGESAKVRLKREGRIAPQEAIAIGLHVATALDYGWRKARLIHRDIKPDNIFLSADGEVKLGDLGLAKSAGQAQDLTTTGDSMGTPHYMSPEQAEAMKDVDLRADIYSLGCTLYHLLSGEPPFIGNSAVAVMMKHLSAPVPDLTTVWPDCPAELAAMVMKMMQKQPADRQQGYEEVIADLRRAHDTLSGASGPTTVAATRGPATSEKRRVPPAAVWLGGAVAVCVVIAISHLAPSKRGGQLPQAERNEKVPIVRVVPSGAQSAAPEGEITPAPIVASKTVAVATTPQPETTPAPTTPGPAAEPSVPSIPVPPASPPAITPKPATEVEKWFAQVDAPQQEVYQKQVLKPFEAGVADLRARYVAALDAAIAKASSAGQLAEALVWRTERQAFEKAHNVAEDDAGTPAGVQTLRAAFRQQLGRLDEERAAKARALLAPYDAVLAKNQLLLTQKQRLDDALLLQTKRDDIALAWLGSAPPAKVVAEGHPESAKPAPTKSTMAATKDAPFVNSLGMKFVPVPIIGGPTNGKRVLFSVWDTRVQDYEVFATETKCDWPKPRFPQDSQHPAVMVSWEDAQRFCQWLTAHERTAGKMGETEIYRLPSDYEWSCAVELGARENAAKLPVEKDDKIEDAFPWGAVWPPPAGAGNYAGEELRPAMAAGKFTYLKDKDIAGYHDGFVNTSPVGSFAANRFGLFDMGGNVLQWCEDWYERDQKYRVKRGSCYADIAHRFLQSSHRSYDTPDKHYENCGFRCVVAESAH